ncbi:Glycerol-3-phosphate dehydrogenase [Mycoemilia scoparia]|uniref:Glycerol-3-phosphate dehydrogenase [NAD(+)] n=1 Tax=Mycoemilia scoparia TaxID=417184 RepID=A0A9W8DPL8_9FUNG|nr:Glycerol-3-phosphate dehydrogenase [Mycoemilia scoparia]
MMAHNNKEKVCILGSGNWGTTAARILANNVKSLDNIDKTINMYVYEELIDGKKLTEIINTQHENVKYLPGFKIPENVIAVPDVVEAVKDANLIVIVMPHQFVKSVLETIKPHIIPSKTKVLSLIKGVVITPKGTVTVSNLIKENLGIHDVSVLSGANIANEIADEQFCESTIGYQVEESAKLWQLLFETPNFRLNCINDVIGVELCGALKNVVAIAAGFVDGLKLGNNSKAAIIRIGLVEMRKIAPYFSDSVKGITFLESCGVADLITTCYGGRNRKLAELFVTTGKSMQELEKIHLNGQKLQGYLTAQEVYEFMVERGIVDEFPLFTKIYKICYEGENVASIFCDLKVSLL